MSKLKIGVTLWSFGQPSTFNEFERLLEQAAATGVKAVQPWCVDVPKWNIACALDPERCATPMQRRNVRKACEKRGLAISAFCAQQSGPQTMGGFGENDDGIDQRLNKTRKAIRMAVEIGVPIVTTHIGPVPEDRDSSTYARFLKSLIFLVKDAERCKGFLAMETGQEKAAVMRQLIEDVGSPNLKVNYDPANMLEHGTLEGVALLGEYIVHTHAKDKHPKTGKPTVGEGGVPWKEYIAALQTRGYDGWYAIEDESGSPSVAESVITGRKFLEQF